MARALHGFVFAWLLATSANAGDINVPLFFHDQPNRASSSVSVGPPNADGFSVTPTADRKTWILTMQHVDAPLAPVTIAVNDAPPGYDAFRLAIDVPYYVVEKDLNLAAVVVNDDPNDDSARDLFDWARGNQSGRAAEWIAIRERARRIFVVRLNQQSDDAQIEASDVNVCYWYLEATTKLLQNFTFFIQIDPGTQQAIDWMRTAMRQHPELFGSQTVPLSKAERLVDILTWRTGFVFTRLVQKLSSDLGSSDAVVVQRACTIAATLQAKLDRADPAEVDRSYPNTLVNQTNLVLCAARKLKSELQAGTEISAAERASANAWWVKLNDMVRTPGPQSGVWAASRAAAYGRLADLRALLR